MPYKTPKDLPKPLRESLPKGAQRTYMKAFNSAWAQYTKPKKRLKGASREVTAHRVAWAAVKKAYHKKKGKWVRK